MTRWLGTVLLLLGVAGDATAQAASCVMPREDLVSPLVRAVVNSSPGGFDYQYTVTNKADAQQTLISFAVEAVAVVPPVQTSPPAWEGVGPIRGSSFFVWNTFTQPRGLPPQASASGFGFTSTGLPTIVRFLAWGNAEVPIIPDRPEPESCANADIIENSFKGTTVGPRTPPDPFVALDALNQLIALLHQSRSQGWIKRDAVHLSMLTKLRDAKRRLEANDPPGANNNVKAFLNEVTGASCDDLSCPGNRPSTSEAYAVLYFNGKYLSDRLP